MVRGLKDEAAQGGGGSGAGGKVSLWEGEDGTSDVSVQGAERVVCLKCSTHGRCVGTGWRGRQRPNTGPIEPI